MNLHHKRITRFDIEGTIYDEAHVDRLRKEYLALVVLQMKSEGYVPRSDIDQDFTFSFAGPKKGYTFRLSVYGVYVGKKTAQTIDSVYGYKPHYSSRPKQKADQKKINGTT